MKYGRSLQELAIELDRQAKVKKDYVATAGAMQMTAVNENFDLVIGNTPFQLNENAHRQLGLQLKIPAPYYERMRAENPGLLMANVNGWFRQSPDTRRMVRTLDGTARAILSGLHVILLADFDTVDGVITGVEGQRQRCLSLHVPGLAEIVYLIEVVGIAGFLCDALQMGLAVNLDSHVDIPSFVNLQHAAQPLPICNIIVNQHSRFVSGFCLKQGG